MKKVLLIAAVALASFTASAQTEKGTVVLGGTAQFETSKEDGESESTDDLTITPVIGYFVANNISLGAGVGYAQRKSALGKAGAFVVSPFGRCYKSLGSEQFKFFGELAVPLAFGTIKNSSDVKVATTSSVGVSLSPGFAFFPTKKFGIELGFNGVSYISTTTKAEVGGAKATNDTFSIGADFFSPQLGLQFYF